MKYKYKTFKVSICAAILCFLCGFGTISAQEDFEYDFLVLEEESMSASAFSSQEELKKLQNQLSELEYYLSELKAQETKALAAVPVSIKNKKFKSVSEKADYYKKLSDEYTAKLSNEELSKSDIKISQNLIILSELYTTQKTISSLKKEIESKKNIKK